MRGWLESTSTSVTPWIAGLPGFAVIPIVFSIACHFAVPNLVRFAGSRKNTGARDIADGQPWYFFFGPRMIGFGRAVGKP